MEASCGDLAANFRWLVNQLLRGQRNIMGIKFDCPNGHSLHVKSFLAGKRGVCPKCGVKLVIPGGLGDDKGEHQENGKKSELESSSPPDLTNLEALREYSQDSLVSLPAAVAPPPVELPQTVSSTGQSSESGNVDQNAADGWFVRLVSGDQFGPASPDLFSTWVREGRVPQGALVWRPGWPEWRPAAEIPECQTNGKENSAQQASTPPAAPTSPSVSQTPQVSATPTYETPPFDGVVVEGPINAVTDSIRIETNRPPTRRVNRTPTIVILLCLTCLLLAIPLVYVFFSSS